MNVRATRFPLFDSLRAIAALCVFATHAYFLYDTNPASPLRAYFIRLDVGVSIFFAISGFLLYRPFVRARLEDTGSPRIVAYLWRRLLRIGPPYWVALTLVTIALPLSGVFTLHQGAYYFGLAQIYNGTLAVGGLPQAWSLGVEVSFYVFLPLYALAMASLPIAGERGRYRAELWGVAVLYVFSTAWNWMAAAIHTNTNFHKPPLHLMLPGYLNTFALGMLLAVLSVWYMERDQPRWMRAVDRSPVLPWLVAAVAFVVVSKGIGLNGGPTEHVSTLQYVLRFALYSVVGGALIAPAVIGDQTRGLVRRLLANRVLLFLGIVSYSFFLYHLAVLEKVQHWVGDSWPAVLLALVGSVAIAVGGYYVVERPFMSLKRLVSTDSSPAALEALAEPAPAAPAEVARSS